MQILLKKHDSALRIGWGDEVYGPAKLCFIGECASAAASNILHLSTAEQRQPPLNLLAVILRSRSHSPPISFFISHSFPCLPISSTLLCIQPDWHRLFSCLLQLLPRQFRLLCLISACSFLLRRISAFSFPRRHLLQQRKLVLASCPLPCPLLLPHNNNADPRRDRWRPAPCLTPPRPCPCPYRNGARVGVAEGFALRTGHA